MMPSGACPDEPVIWLVGGGVIGAALGVWLLSPLIGLGTISQGVCSLGALLVSPAGANILPAVINLFRRGTPR